MSANAKWHQDRERKKKFGRMIAHQLPSIRQKTTVAKMMCMTRVGIDSLESLALFKIFAIMTYEQE